MKVSVCPHQPLWVMAEFCARVPMHLWAMTLPLRTWSFRNKAELCGEHLGAHLMAEDLTSNTRKKALTASTEQTSTMCRVLFHRESHLEIPGEDSWEL